MKAKVKRKKKPRTPKYATGTNGWSYGKWARSGKKSKFFTGYKLYIIKCTLGKEVFFKVGKTFVDLERRFTAVSMPYEYEVIEIIEDEDPRVISTMEDTYHALNKENHYKPLLKFDGSTECFSKLI